MERKEVNSNCRIEDNLSPANKIPDHHHIVQADVTRAILSQKEMHHAEQRGAPHNWEASMQNYETINRARRHEPGEKGSSTFRARSKEPGNIVRG